jgi:deoxyadenosine/deoxycytidine kinase
MTIIISIEGNIGSGKSTLVSELQNHFKNNSDIGFLQEPLDIWNTIKDEQGTTILEKFYQDNEKYAFQFQVMAFTSRLSLIKEAIAKKYKYIITERSLFTDSNIFAKMLYDDKKISEIEYSIYKLLYNQFINEMPVTQIIYVKAEPTTSSQRVIKRNRTGENIPLEYLERCHLYHENWLTNVTNENIMILDGENDIKKHPEIIDEWIIEIKKFICYEQAKLEYSSDTDDDRDDNSDSEKDYITTLLDAVKNSNFRC